MIGKLGDEDVALYPMLKVDECAGHPDDIDEDSVWIEKDCHACAENIVQQVCHYRIPWVPMGAHAYQ